MESLQKLLGIDLPIIQAPMAGVQGHALITAVCNAGGLGSLPCAMLTPEVLRKELEQSVPAPTSPTTSIFSRIHHPNQMQRAKPHGVLRWRRTIVNSVLTPTPSRQGPVAPRSRPRPPNC